LSFEQKRLSFGFRKRIGEAVSKIQLGGMAARFAEVAIGLTRYASLRFGGRLNRDLRARASSTNRPILDDQPGDPPKLSRVVGNQRQAQAPGMSRDKQVVGPNHGAQPF
jgi:hypothetical protein